MSTQAFGRSLLTVADAAAARTAIGAQAAGSYQTLDADLTAISALATTGFVRRTAADTWAASAIAWSDISGIISYGTTAGTVAQGNDSRILNGQTAYGWGNHASAGYALASSVPVASSTTPASLGTAAVGTGTTWARADHVHAMPTAAQVGALAVGAQAADSAKLGGQLPSYYATTASLGDYLPRAGGTLTGPLVGTTGSFGYATAQSWPLNTSYAYFGKTPTNGWNSFTGFACDGANTFIGGTSFVNIQVPGVGTSAIVVSSSAVTLALPLSGASATFTLPASSAGTVLAGQSGAAYSAMGSWLGSPVSHAWFGKAGYNNAVWSGLLTDGNRTRVGANTGYDVRICVQNDIAIFSDAQVTLNRELVGTTASLSGTISASGGIFTGCSSVTYQFPSTSSKVYNWFQGGVNSNQFNISSILNIDSGNPFNGLVASNTNPGIVFRARSSSGTYSNDYIGWSIQSCSTTETSLFIGNGSTSWARVATFTATSGTTFTNSVSIIASNGSGSLSVEGTSTLAKLELKPNSTGLIGGTDYASAPVMKSGYTHCITGQIANDYFMLPSASANPGALFVLSASIPAYGIFLMSVSGSKVRTDGTATAYNVGTLVPSSIWISNGTSWYQVG